MTEKRKDQLLELQKSKQERTDSELSNLRQLYKRQYNPIPLPTTVNYFDCCLYAYICLMICFICRGKREEERPTRGAAEIQAGENGYGAFQPASTLRASAAGHGRAAAQPGHGAGHAQDQWNTTQPSLSVRDIIVALL